MNLVKSSYSKDDSIYLLGEIKDINSISVDLTNKEYLINEHNGNYGTIITKESEPVISVEDFKELMLNNKGNYASLVYSLYKQIYKELGDNVVIVSLMRGGTSLGVLLKRLLGNNSVHYSVSIIKDENIGLDKVAMSYILEKHKDKTLLFVDSWVGQGSILRTLQSSMVKYFGNVEYKTATLVDLEGNLTDYKAATEDKFILSSVLNSTISGLVSRSVCLDSNKMHEAYYYKEFEDIDLSNYFVDTIWELLCKKREFDIVKECIGKYNLSGKHKIKVGINESMRGILRRGVNILIVNDNNKDTKVLVDLAKTKGIRIIKDSGVLDKYGAICILN